MIPPTCFEPINTAELPLFAGTDIQCSAVFDSKIHFSIHLNHTGKIKSNSITKKKRRFSQRISSKIPAGDTKISLLIAGQF